MKLRTNKKMRLKSPCQEWLKATEKMNKEKEKQTFKWIQMDQASLQREVNESLRKMARERRFYKVHKNPCAQLFLLHCTSCHVLGKLADVCCLFYSCKHLLIIRAPFCLSRRHITWINICFGITHPRKGNYKEAWRGQWAMSEEFWFHVYFSKNTFLSKNLRKTTHGHSKQVALASDGC